MLAKEHLAKPFVGQKSWSRALDAQAFDFLAALALEFLGGKRSIARQIGDQFEQTSGEFGQPGDGNGGRISAGVGAEITAHALEKFLNLPAGTRCGSGAHHRRGHFGETRRGMRDECVATAEKQLSGNLRKSVNFSENHLQAVGQRLYAAFRPGHRAFGAKRRNSAAALRGGVPGRAGLRVDCCCVGAAHHAAALATGCRTRIARFFGTRYFLATAWTCAAVTAWKPSSTVLMRFGSPSNRVKHAR